MSPRVSLVVAMARNGVIGQDNSLPWHLPSDLKHFRALTWGHPIVMGRRTFESIGRVLPGRKNVIVTRNPGYAASDQAIFVGSFEEAITACGTAQEIFVIGGAQVYRLAMPYASRLYLTLVDADLDGDARFDAYDSADWRELERQHRPADAANPYACDFVVLERRE